MIDINDIIQEPYRQANRFQTAYPNVFPESRPPLTKGKVERTKVTGFMAVKALHRKRVRRFDFAQVRRWILPVDGIQEN